MLVREIMTEQVVMCTPWDTAHTAANLMREHCVGALPVVWDKADPLVENKRGRCVGIVTQVDIARKVPPTQIAEMISEITKPMSKERESFFEKDHFYRKEISRLMAEERDSTSQADYFYFGRTHEEDEILLLYQRRRMPREILAAA